MTSEPNGRADVLVRVNPPSFENRRNITGEIWLQVGDFSFPAQSWTDFPVIILSWWLDALDTLQSANSVAEFLFMDGPYSFTVSRRNGVCTLQCTEDPRGDKESLWQGVVNLDALASQVRSAAASVVQECRRLGWATPDTSSLESKVAALGDLQSA
jgi:hypothetical protein